MKTLPTIAATVLAAFLILSPVMAMAATSYTLSVSTDKTSYAGNATGTISFTVTPAPGSGTSAGLTITNPNGAQVFTDSATVSATGTATDTFTTGGSSNWISGTYTVTASWALTVSGTPQTTTSTFTYTCVSGCSSTPGSAAAISIVGNSNSLVYVGQTAQIYALAYWNNGTAVKNGVWTATVLGPTGSAPSPSITWTVSSPATGVALWTGSIPTGSSDGVYAVEISDTEGGITGWTQTAFTVNGQVANGNAIASAVSSLSGLANNISAISSQLSSIANNVNSINTALGSVTSQLGSVNTAVQGLGTQLTSLSNTVSGISSSISSITGSITTLTNDVTQMQTTVSSLGGLASDMSSLQSSVSSLNTSVSNEQTYILVVAALAVITLVLELAILIRKMS